MKQVSALVATALLATSALTGAAAADEGGTTFVPAQTENQYLAKDHLIGAKVTGKEGKIIGDVEDLIVNDQNQVIGVVLGTGGYFGFAEKDVAVDLSSLKFEDKGGTMTVSLPDVTQETIDQAPAFQRAKPPKSVFERAREKVNELTDKTTTSTEKAIEQAKPMLDDAKKQAEDAIEKAKEAAAPALEKAKEAVNDAIGTAKTATEEAIGTTTEAAPPAGAPTDAPAADAPAAAPETPAAPAETPAQP